MAGRGKIENLRPPWKPGESGNFSGRPKRKPVYDALLEAADPQTLRRIAREALARAGKSPAMFALVRDTLDGKPVSQVREAANGESRQAVLHVMYDDE